MGEMSMVRVRKGGMTKAISMFLVVVMMCGAFYALLGVVSAHTRIDMGATVGGIGEAWHINAQGQVVGGYGSGFNQAFLVNPKDINGDGSLEWFEPDGSGGNKLLQVLGSMRTGAWAEADAINSMGQIAGTGYCPSTGTDQVYLITPLDNSGDGLPDIWFVDGGSGVNTLMQPILDAPFADRGIWCWDMNENGNPMIVGLYFTDGSGPFGYEHHACVWSAPTGWVALGTLGGDHSLATVINDNGIIVGYADDSSGIERAFVIEPEFDGTSYTWFKDTTPLDGINDLMTDLGSIGGTVCRAQGVNNVLTVVGYGLDALGHSHALRWDKDGSTWHTTDLTSEVPSWVEGAAYTVNDKGDIAGMRNTAPGAWDERYGVPIVYNGANFHDLETAGTGIVWWISAKGIVAGGMDGKPAIWKPDQRPTAVFTATPTYLSVAFDASLSVDWDGAIDSYAWDFGDLAAPGYGVAPSHMYASGGIYTVTLTVTDNDGLTDTAAIPVTVSAPPPYLTVNNGGHSTTSGSGWYDLGTWAAFSVDSIRVCEAAWSYTTGAGVSSSPAVADGRVYIGSSDGKIYALNLDGSLAWSYTAGGGPVESSPAVADGRVYVGSGNGKVYALNSSTGALAWSYETGAPVGSSPAVADGRVYVGSDDYKVYALDASTGALAWSYQTFGPVLSSPAVADGRVYVGSCDDKVYALDASTGALAWNYTTGGWVLSSPAVADGRVYVGSWDSMRGIGKVYALDASTGALAWSYTTGGAVRSSPAVADGRVYVGSGNGKVYALNLDGTLAWSYQTFGLVFSSPTVADGRVYIGSDDGKVYALDASTGALAWSYTTGDIVRSSPAVADGRVYVGSADGKVYALLDDVCYVFTGWSGDSSSTEQTATILMDGPKTVTAKWQVPPIAVPPVAGFDSTATGLSVALDASASFDPDGGAIVSYAWDFGDFKTATVDTPTVVHDYWVEGTYTITLTVIDDEGQTGTASATLTVSAPPLPEPEALMTDLEVLIMECHDPNGEPIDHQTMEALKLKVDVAFDIISMRKSGGSERAFEMRKSGGASLMVVFISMTESYTIVGKIDPGDGWEMATQAALIAALLGNQKMIVGIPNYEWYAGCGPTAAGMIMAYWDAHGFDALVKGEPGLLQTPDVNTMMASKEHLDEYALGPNGELDDELDEDYSGPIIRDASQWGPNDPTPHIDNCLADFMRTSRSSLNLRYGQSIASNVVDGLVQYAANGPRLTDPTSNDKYVGVAKELHAASLTWADLKSQVDTGHPMALTVDANGDGDTDHLVTVVGYCEIGSARVYAFHSTWDNTIWWANFEIMHKNVCFGVYSGFLFDITEVTPPR